MDTFQDRVGILQQEAKAFREYLSGLSPDALQHPSACDRWTVADVLSHVGTQAFALQVARGLQGNGLIPWFIESLDRSVQVFQGLAAEDWDKLCYWPPGPEPVGTMLDMRISELTMHVWDIRSMLDQDYHLSQESVRVLMDTVNRAARRAFRPDAELSVPVRYRFVVAFPVARSVDLEFTRDGAQIGPAVPETADVTFRCDGETYVLVLYGRLAPEDAISDGRMAFQGDAGLTARFGPMFKGG